MLLCFILFKNNGFVFPVIILENSLELFILISSSWYTKRLKFILNHFKLGYLFSFHSFSKIKKLKKNSFFIFLSYLSFSSSFFPARPSPPIRNDLKPESLPDQNPVDPRRWSTRRDPVCGSTLKPKNVPHSFCQAYSCRCPLKTIYSCKSQPSLIVSSMLSNFKNFLQL